MVSALAVSHPVRGILGILVNGGSRDPVRIVPISRMHNSTAYHVMVSFDGDSGGRDFLTWQRQLGNGTIAAAAQMALPEPASWILLLLGKLLGTLRVSTR